MNYQQQIMEKIDMEIVEEEDYLANNAFTPREIVSELDKYIISQNDAKRCVAIALRNRWRRQRVGPELREEIAPKNIIMIGPTGVGKTEIARRLANLSQAPFIKVEASKFTEVGYVGRDVDSMIRDLTELSVKMVKDKEQEAVKIKALLIAESKVLEILLPSKKTEKFEEAEPEPEPELFDQEEGRQRTYDKLRTMLKEGKLDDRFIDLEISEGMTPNLKIFSATGIEEMDMNFQEILGNILPKRTKKKRVQIPEALQLIAQEEAAKLIDMDKVIKNAVKKVEQTGIVFLDELDKISGRETGKGPDVSREGVQRDILPIVEGSTVITKYGMVKTDHILFIAAGAFHVSRPSDLIPELQGRFPIRVELQSLGKEEFIRILTEPQNSLVKQY